MIYERITQSELYNLKLENGVEPNYTYERYIVDEDTEEIIYINLTIHKTADEVYQDHLLYMENRPIELQDKISNLEKQVAALEEENMTLSEYVLGLEMKSLEQEETVIMTNEYVLDLDMRLTNIEIK